jgi:hypothetical protein
MIGGELLMTITVELLDAAEAVQLLAIAVSWQIIDWVLLKYALERLLAFCPAIRAPLLYQAHCLALMFSVSPSISVKFPALQASVLFLYAGLGEMTGTVRLAGRWSG